MAHNENDNPVILARHLAALLNVPPTPMMMAMIHAIHEGPDFVNELFAHVAETTENLRQILRQSAADREVLKASREAEVKAEIEMLEMWMDIPAYGREV